MDAAGIQARWITAASNTLQGSGLGGSPLHPIHSRDSVLLGGAGVGVVGGVMLVMLILVLLAFLHLRLNSQTLSPGLRDYGSLIPSRSFSFLFKLRRNKKE